MAEDGTLALEPAYAQRLSQASYCVYLKDNLPSTEVIHLLSCVLQDHGYVVQEDTADVADGLTG